ncbi:hypothetical protein MRX96_006538 [Rhipicephalus microplus]
MMWVRGADKRHTNEEKCAGENVLPEEASSTYFIRAHFSAMPARPPRQPSLQTTSLPQYESSHQQRRAETINGSVNDADNGRACITLYDGNKTGLQQKSVVCRPPDLVHSRRPPRKGETGRVRHVTP